MSKQKENEKLESIESQAAIEPEIKAPDLNQVTASLPRDPNRALEPGRIYVPLPGVCGEIADLIYKAQQEGNHEAVAELSVLETKIGDMLTHVTNMEKVTESKARSIYHKIAHFFVS